MQSASSADDQIRDCREYAARQGWEVVGVEKDEAVRAGALAARDGYARVLQAAQTKSFDVLLVEEISRFSRDFLGGMTAMQGLTQLKVKIADTRIGLVDLDSSAGQMMLSVHLMQSHGETKKLGERSKRGLKTKTLDKDSAGGLPAYGFKREARYSETITDVDGRPKRLGVRFVPDPETAPTVVRIFELYRDGVAKIAIARQLNTEKVPTRGKKTWSDSTIAAMLSNEVYTGLRVWNKTSRKGEKLPNGKKAQLPNPESEWIRVEDWCDRIVDSELWGQVQERLKADAQEHATTKTTGKHRQYLLSGLLVCGDCGGKFVIGSHFQGVLRYRCGRRASRGGDVACLNKLNVPQAALEVKIKYVLDVLAKDPEKLQVLVQEHNDRIKAHNSGHLSAVVRIEAQLQEAQTAVRNLVSAVEQGLATKALLTSLAKREAEAEALEAELTTQRAQLQPLLFPKLHGLQEFAQGSKSIWTGDFVADRLLLDRTLEALRVHPDGTLTVHFRQASLFGPLGTYTIHDPEAGFQASMEDQRKLHRMMKASMPGTITVADHGGRLVITNATPESETPASSEGSGGLVSGVISGQDSENNSCVPSGI